ncbi:hypothetical protein GGU10DRAFT_73419 [Lentinula aff. detonsa]|uniref:Protein PNS1 n=1 Tax=Lentinula aff. detonsa TaxID=2804958 RepID=A0AA38NC26_9AGAR|nr:hypothetical protein GGU10DRAFT_73419 [Lentinula aff. detonsa]
MRNSFAVYASQFLNRRTDDWDGDGDGDSNKDGNGNDEDGDGESRMFYSFATLEGGGSGWDRWNGEGEREGSGEELELELEGGSGWLTGQFQETLTEPLLPPQTQPQPMVNRIQGKVIKTISVISLWVWIGGVCMTYVLYFTLPNSIGLEYTYLLFMFGWIVISAMFSYAYMFFFVFRFQRIGVVGTPLLLLLLLLLYTWSFSLPSLFLLIPLSILVVYRLSTLPLLFTNLKNQQNLLRLTKELSLHDIPLFLVIAPLGVVLGVVGSVPFGWVLWDFGVGHGHPVLGFGIGVVWVWSWGVLRGLLGVISAWVVGRWYHTNNTKGLLPCLHSSLPTISLSSLILSSTQILTFLINLSFWFSLWSLFSPWVSSSVLVWCLHRITAKFNPYTLVYIGFTGGDYNHNHSLSIPNRPINKVSSPLPLPLAFILAFALITYSPSPSPTLLTLTLTSTLVSSFCTSLVNDIGDALWLCWLLGQPHQGHQGLSDVEKRKRVREVFDYSSTDSRHSLPSPNSLDSPNSVDSDSISVIVHSRTRGTQTHRSSRNVDTDVINTMDTDTMDGVDMDMGMGTGIDTNEVSEVSEMDETDLDPFVPAV